MVSAHNVNPSKPVTFLSQAVSSIPMDGFSGFYDSVSLKSKSVQQSTHLIIIHEWYIYLHVCNLKSTKYTINVHMGGFHHLPWVLHNIEDFTPLVGPYCLELLVVGNHSSTYSANIYIYEYIYICTCIHWLMCIPSAPGQRKKHLTQKKHTNIINPKFRVVTGILTFSPLKMMGFPIGISKLPGVYFQGLWLLVSGRVARQILLEQRKKPLLLSIILVG